MRFSRTILINSECPKLPTAWFKRRPLCGQLAVTPAVTFSKIIHSDYLTFVVISEGLPSGLHYYLDTVNLETVTGSNLLNHEFYFGSTLLDRRTHCYGEIGM